MTPGADRGAVRLAELVATLSLATDLGRGEPMEHCLRQTVIALRSGERIGIGERDRVAQLADLIVDTVATSGMAPAATRS